MYSTYTHTVKKLLFFYIQRCIYHVHMFTLEWSSALNNKNNSTKYTLSHSIISVESLPLKRRGCLTQTTSTKVLMKAISEKINEYLYGLICRRIRFKVCLNLYKYCVRYFDIECKLLQRILIERYVLINTQKKLITLHNYNFGTHITTCTTI